MLGDGSGDVQAQVTRLLEQAGLQADIAIGQPNLEDVFVAATHMQAATAEHAT